jgi:hypothetical protein
VSVSVDFDQNFERMTMRLHLDDGSRSLDQDDQNFETRSPWARLSLYGAMQTA